MFCAKPSQKCSPKKVQSCKAKNTGIVPSKTKKTYTAPKESLLVAVHKWTAYHNKYTYAALHKSINCYLLNILRTCPFVPAKTEWRMKAMWLKILFLNITALLYGLFKKLMSSQNFIKFTYNFEINIFLNINNWSRLAEIWKQCNCT